jgi:hypothetical protein
MIVTLALWALLYQLYITSKLVSAGGKEESLLRRGPIESILEVRVVGVTIRLECQEFRVGLYNKRRAVLAKGQEISINLLGEKLRWYKPLRMFV